jgi:hypothetical protein
VRRRWSVRPSAIRGALRWGDLYWRTPEDRYPSSLPLRIDTWPWKRKVHRRSGRTLGSRVKRRLRVASNPIPAAERPRSRATMSPLGRLPEYIVQSRVGDSVCRTFHVRTKQRAGAIWRDLRRDWRDRMTPPGAVWYASRAHHPSRNAMADLLGRERVRRPARSTAPSMASSASSSTNPVTSAISDRGVAFTRRARER